MMVPWIKMLTNQIKRQHMPDTKELDISDESLLELDVIDNYSHQVIVPINNINAMEVKALRYARSFTPDVIAFHIEVYEGEADQLRQKWGLIHTKIPLIIKSSAGGDVIDLLTEFIDSIEQASQPGSVVTVLLPQLVVSHGWRRALHSNTILAETILEKSDINVLTMPFYLDDVKTGHDQRAGDKA